MVYLWDVCPRLDSRLDFKVARGMLVREYLSQNLKWVFERPQPSPKKITIKDL